MLGISSVFKKTKPRQFSYKPLYYDQEKEQRDEKFNKNNKEYKPGSLVKGMRNERYCSSDIHSERMAAEKRNRTTIRLVLIIFMLILVGIALMNSTFLEGILMVFTQGK